MLDNGPLPPVLRRAFDFQQWGGDVSRLPPGVLPQMTQAYNAFKTLDSYSRASGNVGEWAKRNPRGWAFVDQVYAMRWGIEVNDGV